MAYTTIPASGGAYKAIPATAQTTSSGYRTIPSNSSFVPSSIAGLVLDLDANLGVTLTSGKVSGWADQSGLHNDVTQANAGKQTVVTTNVFGSLPGITGTASTGFVGAVSPLSAGSARAIFAVVKGGGASGASGGTLCAFRASPGFVSYYFDLSSVYYGYSSRVVNDTFTGSGTTICNVAHVVTMTATVGSLPVIRVDGIAQTVVGGNNVVSDSGTDSFTVMTSDNVMQGFIGNLGRELIYNNVPSAGNITLLERYLGAIYGITVA